MEFILDNYIDRYIQDAKAHMDKEIARHLKNIIPWTTHLDEDTFNEIIEALKTEVDNGKDFKAAFQTVCPKYILNGDVIKAKLPRLLTRIILDDTEFLGKVSEELGTPLERDEIKRTVFPDWWIQRNIRKINLRSWMIPKAKPHGEENETNEANTINRLDVPAFNRCLYPAGTLY
jgi:hypothetical protein